MPSGTVLSLHRFPVKSMAGEAVASLAIGEHGAEGDRKRAVWLRGGRRLTARVAPRMLAWRASLNGGLTVTAPDGRVFGWTKELEAAVGEYLGREVALVEDPHGLHDVQGTLLVTVEASRGRLADELGIDLDIRRFRTNVHVDLGDAEPFAESGWEGRRIRVGEAELEIVHPCDRCAITIHDPDTLEPTPDVLRVINDRHDTFFGFRVQPLGAASVSVGDAVQVL
ncbi:MAG TPA: MOSC N-terminal beta barrel domain-containing protein [Solirubrobacteraceae bacterium]|nr:MOSC N-terminal beta barrel domain-containing protein [Solirubrobacteraceae bacterium]